MSHVFHQLYYHFVWSTLSREPLIDRSWRPHLLEIINQEVHTRGGFPLRRLYVVEMVETEDEDWLKQ